MEADFSGYATKANLKCSDGRTITPDAFKHQDRDKVPLVWQHSHDQPSNVLGHAVLEHRADGIYAYGYFNETEMGQTSKTMVKHGDIVSLSIYANKLVEKNKTVMHGQIREVSLVLAGANPGAMIEYVNFTHSDGEIEVVEDEAIIHGGQPLENSDTEDEVATVEHADEGKTIKDVVESMTEEQQNVVYFLMAEAMKGSGGSDVSHSELDVSAIYHSMNEDQQKVLTYLVGEALDQASGDDVAAAHAEDKTDDTAAHADNKEGSIVTNVFENNDATTAVGSGSTLSHSDTEAIFKRAKRLGSLKEAVQEYASDSLKHGIDDIDVLFPDAKSVTNTPDFLKRRTEWVAEVMTGTRHTPFARIKSMTANLTLEDARAKGYVKGNFKKEEFFKVSKRVTTPQTIYKKQQLDRDDVVDITDFDVVVWIKAEMRLMLEEEIARAVLIGDGRSAGDPDKISEENVRPIATDNDLYVTRLYTNVDPNSAGAADQIVESLILQRRHYRGSGNPTLYTSENLLARMLLAKESGSSNKRLYQSQADLAVALRVSKIVAIEAFDAPSVTTLAILVNLADYTIGADRGGDVTLFDDFDIDYNQYKYLIETRICGALVKPKSALVVERVASNSVLVDPVAPTFNNTNKTVTVANTPGITYRNKLGNTALAAGSPVTLVEGDELTVLATPNAGFHLASNAADEFLFTYERGRVDAGIV